MSAIKNIQSFLVYDNSGSTLRPDASEGVSPTTPRKKLGALLAKALGTLKADRSRKNVYYVDEGCVQVRQTVPVDRFYTSSEVCDGSEPFDVDTKPLIDSVFDDGNDVLVVIGGFHGTAGRSRQLHGSTLELPTAVTVAADASFTFVEPPRETWGLLLKVVDYVIHRATAADCSVSTSAIRIQLDNVVDALISPSALKVKFGDTNQGQRIRQQYSKLLALTSASTLDVDDDAGVAKITDQTVCNLHTIADFFHVVNCFSATASSKSNAPTRASSSSVAQKGSAPSHCLTTIRIVSATAPVRRIHFLELADYDWSSSSKEDQDEYHGALDNLTNVLNAIGRRNDLALDAVSRKFTLTHVLCSQLRSAATKMIFYGHTKYSSSLEMMKLLSKATSTPIRTVLHGPDLEGEMEVDIELRNHLEEIQKECEDLQEEVDDALERRQELDLRIRTTDEELARLDQRRATMVRMSFAARKKLDPIDEDTKQEAAELTSTSREKKGDLHFLNAARCYTLREELKELQRTHVKVMRTAQKQLEILTAERSRTEGKVSKLQSEHDKTREKWKHQCLEHAKQKEALRKEFAVRSSAILDARRQEAELETAERRKIVVRDLEQSKARAAEQLRLEMEAEEQLRQRLQVEAENATTRRTYDEDLKKQLNDVQADIAIVDADLATLRKTEIHEQAAVDNRLRELEQSAAVLNEFAFRMSSLLSSIEKRMHHPCMVHILVHTTQQRHSADSIALKTEMLNRWIANGGLASSNNLGGTQSPLVVSRRLLLEKAESMVHTRLAAKATSSASTEEHQKTFDLRASIAIRETLKGELEQHKARRGRLTELHNELNVAEEHLCSIKIDANDHEMFLVETKQKIMDVESHMQILINDLTGLKDQLPKLYEIEVYHQGQIDVLRKECIAAEEMVSKKKQMVIETEENLNYIMNVGMSSQMWSNEEKRNKQQSTDKALARSHSKKWAQVGKMKGEDIIYEDNLTPRTDAWGKKQRERKTKYLWRVLHNAMKLGYLTHKIPFPPDAFVRMMNHIHGSDDAVQIKKLQEELSSSQRIVQDQSDAIRKLERIGTLKAERSKEAELKLAAIQQKYEKARVELAAVKRVIASMEDKSVTQLQKENVLYEVERRNLYSKMYGKQREGSPTRILVRQASMASTHDGSSPREDLSEAPIPINVEIPSIVESKLAHMESFGSTSSRPGITESTIHTLTDAVMEARACVESQVFEFNAPHGTGFLQQQLDKYVEDRRHFTRKLDALKLQRNKMQRKLEISEGLAMHAFDAYARGRQTVEEEIDQIIVEQQRFQKRQLEKQIEERTIFEQRLLTHEKKIEKLERDYNASQEYVASLEERSSTLADAKMNLEEELRITKEELAVASSSLSGDDTNDLDRTLEKLRSSRPQDIVDYDTAIGRILPMKSQRAFSNVVLKLAVSVQQTFLFVATHLQRLFHDSVRRTTATTQAATSLGAKLNENFDNLLTLCSSIGRTGLDAVENWDAFKRELYVDAETDIDGLPTPTLAPQIVEVPPPPVETMDAQVQAGDPLPARTDRNNMSSQTTTVIKKDKALETTIVLGKGNGEGMGYVSTESVRRMEDLLKVKIREADSAQQTVESNKKKAAMQRAHYIAQHQLLHMHSLQVEDTLAHAAQAFHASLAAEAHRPPPSVGVDVATSIPNGDLTMPRRDFQSQIFFAPTEHGLDNIVALATTSTNLAVVCESFRQPPVLLANCGVQAAPPVIEVCHASVAASPVHYSMDPSPPAEKMEKSTPTTDATTPPNALGEQQTPPKVLAIMAALSSPKSNIHSKVSSPTAAVAPLAKPVVELVAAATQTEEPARIDPVVSPGSTMLHPALTTFDPMFGECSFVDGRNYLVVSPPPSEPIRVSIVDEELTAKTIAELQRSLETKLTDQFEQHKQLLEDQIQVKADNFDRHSEQVESEALKLRLRVSDMQQNYEAIAASVTKFKYVAKQLESTKEELEKERAKRLEVETKLQELSDPIQKSVRGKKRIVSIAPSSEVVASFQGSILGSNPTMAGAASANRRSRQATIIVDPATSDAEIRLLKRDKESLTMQLEVSRSKVAELEQKIETLSEKGPLSVGTSAPREASTRSSRAAQRLSVAYQVPSMHGEEDNTLVAQLNDRLNEAQMQLLSAHNEVLASRAKYSTDTLALKQEIENIKAAKTEKDGITKKAETGEKRAKLDLERERKLYLDAEAAWKEQRAENDAHHATELGKLEQQLATERKNAERVDKLYRGVKKHVEELQHELSEAKALCQMERTAHHAKSRAAATLVSQIHCGLVEAAVSIKTVLQLTSLQLADAMMGDTAVQLMRALSSESKSLGAHQTVDAMLDMSRYLGDRDVELLRRITAAVTQYGGGLHSAESSRPGTRETTTSHRQDILLPLPLSPIGSPRHTMLAAMEPTTLPQLEWRSRSPPKRPAFDVHLAERDQSFTLFHTPAGAAGNRKSVTAFAKVADAGVKSFATHASQEKMPPTSVPVDVQRSTEPSMIPVKTLSGIVRSVSTPPDLSVTGAGRSQTHSCDDVRRIVHDSLPVRGGSRRETRRVK